VLGGGIALYAQPATKPGYVPIHPPRLHLSRVAKSATRNLARSVSQAALDKAAAKPLGAKPSTKASTSPTFERDVLPVVQKYCVTCHISPDPVADLDLDKFKTTASVLKNPKIWERVAQNVHASHMPPAKMPQPTPSPRHSHSIYRHARFNLAQLLELSKGLRNRPCVCDESQVPMFGAFSWAIILKFDDDVEWIFRSPRTDHVEISRDTSCRVLASEAATLRYLRQHTSIPVPDVHDFW